MGTQPRIGFERVTRIGPFVRSVRPVGCPSGKARHSSEAAAVEALVRVRRERIESGDPRPHESHLYPCERCDGYHLSSTPVLIPQALIPERPQRENEPITMYARRLENRIKEQRTQILSLLAAGNGATNRESRKRITSRPAASSVLFAEGSSVTPRFYVHESRGYRIDPATASVGGRPRALPVCFYVLDRDDNHRPVGQFPPGVFWHSRGRTFEKARRDAAVLCARLNAEDKAEAA